MAELTSHVLKFWRPEPKGRKMAAKKVGDFVTGTINSHFFIMGHMVTFFARVSYLYVTDRYETGKKRQSVSSIEP